MTTWNRPIRWQGSPEQAAANRATHQWMRPAPDETPECMECCAKTWHAAADYPCGEDPPREDVELPTPSKLMARESSRLPPRRDLDD